MSNENENTTWSNDALRGKGGPLRIFQRVDVMQNKINRMNFERIRRKPELLSRCDISLSVWEYMKDLMQTESLLSHFANQIQLHGMYGAENSKVVKKRLDQMATKRLIESELEFTQKRHFKPADYDVLRKYLEKV